jgi:hypothetical protein
MNALSGYDLMWLRLDRPGSVGHYGMMPLFTPEAGVPLGAAEMREQIAERLPRLPALRRVVASDPSAPRGYSWADVDVDLDRHVFEHRLSGAADRVELGALAAKLNAVGLDHSRPLWEIHVVTGLWEERVAALIKLHHATGDGSVGAVVVETLFDAQVDHGEGFIPTGRAPDPAGSNGRRRSEDVVLPSGPITRFNQPVSNERGYAFGSVAVERVQALKRATGTTFTEALVALWAGALRGWLAMRGELPGQPLVARMPVSTRTADDTVDAGNQLVMVLVGVPTHLPDFRARAEAARGSLLLARQNPAVPGARGGRANLSISVMMGPRPPMNWRGVPMIAMYSITIVNNLGLSIVCITRGDEVMIGVHVDSTHVADPWTIVRAFEAALDDAEAA